MCFVCTNIRRKSSAVLSIAGTIVVYIDDNAIGDSSTSIGSTSINI